MADRIVELDGIQHHFPEDATDAEIAASLGGDLSGPDVNGVGPALTSAVAAKAVPTAANLAMRFGTNPNAPKVGSVLGRITGAVAAPITGAIEGGLPGFAAGMVSAPSASWMGGKTGWFGTKMLQSAARPIAGALDAVAPYAEAAGKVAGPQGLLDLAQMAEPTRKDIGFLGIGPTTPEAAADPGGLQGHFGGAGTMSWSETAKAVRDAVLRRLLGQP